MAMNYKLHLSCHTIYHENSSCSIAEIIVMEASSIYLIKLIKIDFLFFDFRTNGNKKK